MIKLKMSMLRVLLFSLFLLTNLIAEAENKKEVQAFARTICNSQQLTAGDSIIVSVVIYASSPFKSVKAASNKDRIVEGFGRPLYIRNHNANQRVQEGDKIFYTYVFEQYVIGSEKTGTIKIPSIKFKAQFVIYDEPVTPYHEFWGIVPQHHIAEETITLAPYSINVIPRPKRSTKELMQNGGVL